MKYLKRYKLFEELPWTADGVYKHEEDSVQKRVADKIKEVEYIKETIKDILLPVSDLGYYISVTDNALNSGPFYKSPNEFIIRVVRYGDKGLSITDDVNYEFDRMNYYLESLGFEVSVKYVYGSGRSEKKYSDFSKIIESTLNSGRQLMVSNLLFVAKTDN